MSLEQIIARGTRDARYQSTGVSNSIRCADGFKVSIIAGGGAYSTPRSDGYTDSEPGPFSAVEVGFPTARPEPWADWEQYCKDPKNPMGTVYGYVPVDMARALVASHGGEVAP